MSQENVEIVRRGIEALNRRDIDAWLEGFQPDVEAHDLPTIPDAPVRRGHEDLRRWVGMMGDTWEVEVSFFWVFEMRDGKVQRSWAYFDEEEALEAAGLRD